MTRLFQTMRMVGHGIILTCTIITLGIAAYLASVFLDVHYLSDFIIYTLVVTSITILLFIFLSSYSQPRTELLLLSLMAIGWVAEAAWATDIVSGVRCSQISGGDRLDSGKGPDKVSARSVCYEEKAIMAAAWTNFALIALFIVLLIALATRAHALGRPYIWSEPIAELPWFGQFPGYEADPRMGEQRPPFMHQGSGFYPGMPMIPAQMMMAQPGYPANGLVVQQQPGHSIVIQPGQNGGQPQIQQVPHMGSHMGSHVG